MAVSANYLQYVLDQLASLGRVTPRRMFGAVGLYCEEHFFAIIDNDTLFFKVDDSNRPDYESRGMAAFRPYADRPEVSMTYFEVPADALEDSAELIQWGRRSVAVARRAPKSKPKKKRPRQAL
jgi:DNA transformation protein and related proteins